MPTYTFIGTVQAMGNPITIASRSVEPSDHFGPVPISRSFDDGSFTFDAWVSIVASHIKVIVMSNSNDLLTIGNYVDETVRMLLDAYGYIHCEGYGVEITHYVNHNEGIEAHPFSTGRVAVGQDYFDSEFTLDNVMNLIILQPPISNPRAISASSSLHYALADIREAIRNPHATALFCYRAVESIKQCYDGKWDSMNAALRLEESWVKDFVDERNNQTHGIGQYTSGPRRTEMIKRTRAVIDRFMWSAQNDFNPLPKTFDILK